MSDLTKWEYKAISVSDTHVNDRSSRHAVSIEQVLNALGQDGWELVAMSLVNAHAYFKRPITA
jgi:hypothetical protein